MALPDTALGRLHETNTDLEHGEFKIGQHPWRFRANMEHAVRIYGLLIKGDERRELSEGLSGKRRETPRDCPTEVVEPMKDMGVIPLNVLVPRVDFDLSRKSQLENLLYDWLSCCNWRIRIQKISKTESTEITIAPSD